MSRPQLLLCALLLALPAGACALVRYQAVSELTAMGGAPQRATATCWLAPDRMRVEGAGDMLIVRADRELVWVCDRKSKRYREYSFAQLRKLLPVPEAKPAPAAPPPAPALGAKEVAGHPALGYSFLTVTPIRQDAHSKEQIPVTWQLDLWTTTTPPQICAVYDALNARLASAHLPLVALRGALAVTEAKPHPLLAGYAQAMALLSAPLAAVKGMPLVTEVWGAVLPPGMANLDPAQRKVVMAEDESVARLLTMKTENSEMAMIPDDQALFELPADYRKAK